jgi:hypothetical protein
VSRSEKNPPGRTIKTAVPYSAAVAAEILRRLSEGETLEEICGVGEMPSVMSVWRWRRERPEFGNALLDARRQGAETLSERIIELSRSANGMNIPEIKALADRLRELRRQVDATVRRTTKRAPKLAELHLLALAALELPPDDDAEAIFPARVKSIGAKSARKALMGDPGVEFQTLEDLVGEGSAAQSAQHEESASKK